MTNNSTSVKLIIENCTCSICQDLFDSPVTIRCNHTFCRKCLDCFVKKSDKRRVFIPGIFGPVTVEDTSENVLQCPICRGLFLPNDEFKPNIEAQKQVEQLKAIKGERCEAADCWNSVADAPWSDKRFCSDHHHQHLEELHVSSQKLLSEMEAAANQEEEKALIQQLEEMRLKIPEQKKALAESVERHFNAFEEQLLEMEAKIREGSHDRSKQFEPVRDDYKHLTRLVEMQDLRGLEQATESMQNRLARCRRENPPLKLATTFESKGLLSGFDNLLSSVQVGVHAQPYEELKSSLKTTTVLRTGNMQPWDIQLITNVEGLVFVDRVLKYRCHHPDGEPVAGALLAVNFKSFPTGKLHLTDMNGKEVGCIKMEFEKVGMPDRFCINNERQLIFASDAGRGALIVANIEGKVLNKFTSMGDSGEFNKPLGICCRGGILYLTDTGNKRVLLLDVDNNFCHVGTICHDGFSRVCDVAATPLVIAVLDQETGVHIFDKKTKRYQRRHKLKGSGFGLACDTFGNIVATVPETDEILIFDPQGMECTKRLSIVEPSDEEDDEESPENFFAMMMAMHGKCPKIYNGLAIHTRRLFVADTARRHLLLVDL